MAATASGRTWKVVPDGSLSGGENSGEIVSPVLGSDDIEELQNIIRAVRTAGAKADLSTGIHIHVGAERFDAKSVVNLVKLVHKQERLLEHALVEVQPTDVAVDQRGARFRKQRWKGRQLPNLSHGGQYARSC